MAEPSQFEELEPIPTDRVADFDPRRVNEGQLETIAGHMRGIIDALGLDRTDPNLEATDRRVAKMYLEMFNGMRSGAEPHVTMFPNDEGYEHMVMERDIPFYSMCSHHFVPFYGHAHMAYVPGERFCADGSGGNCLRLAFSFVEEERINLGIERLARTIRQEL